MRFALLAPITLLCSACATIVPQSTQPQASQPPQARVAPSADQAARPVPATPGTPLSAPPVPASATNAAGAGVVAGPADATSGIAHDNAVRALTAFRLSCPSLLRRVDASGLTQAGDWTAPCAAARGWSDADAPRFFAQQFRAVQVGDGRGQATGYFEPEIAGSRTRSARFSTPVYGVPADLVEVDLGQFSATLAGKKIRGRMEEGRLIPYFDRAAIDGGALAERGLEIAWAEDAIELFWLHIQGSGRLRLPDGSVMRIGYANQNGHDFVGIGRLLINRGEIPAAGVSMQSIIAHMRAQSDGGAALMRENPSWIFFREITGPGPLGSLNVPVTGRASVAADPAYIPLGAPVLLSLDRAEPNGLWIAQDTGGAIRGPNRVDTFWGAGAEARAIAGGMNARGAVLLLLPHISVERLLSVRRPTPVQ
ncbi:MAG: MltA domain-containing protein [Sphingopyxis sp.]